MCIEKLFIFFKLAMYLSNHYNFDITIHLFVRKSTNDDRFEYLRAHFQPFTKIFSERISFQIRETHHTLSYMVFQITNIRDLVYLKMNFSHHCFLTWVLSVLRLSTDAIRKSTYLCEYLSLLRMSTIRLINLHKE